MDKLKEIEENALEIVGSIMSEWKEGHIAALQADIDMTNTALKVLDYVQRVKNADKYDWEKMMLKIMSNDKGLTRAVQTITDENGAYTIEGDTLTTEYEGKTAVFDIVERNGNEFTLVSRDILCFEPFDVKYSNDYDASSIKRFLHKEFTHRFGKEFISKLSDEGFYLLSEDEVKKYYPEEEKRIKYYKEADYPYWTRTPSSSYSTGVRGVNTDGSLDNHYAYNMSIGVAPACKVIL